MIIGLTGYAQSGKDTVAKILIDNYGYTRVAFADAIRELLYEMDPQIYTVYSLKLLVDAYGWDATKQRPEVRRILQNLGVGAKKVFGDTFWIHQALRNVHFEGNYVITDVRFPNEAKALKQYDNAQIWNIKRLDVGPINDHITEHAMDGYVADVTILNNWTIEDLETLVRGRMDHAKSISQA